LRRAPHRTARGLLVSLASALAALGCAGEPTPKTTVLAKVPERIVILPLNVTTPLPAEIKDASAEVWSALEVYLRAHGAALKTVSYSTARGLWLTSIRDARADPKLKDPGFDDAARLLTGKLKQYAEFDALIFPSLYVQRATLAGTNATWDGSERTIQIETPRGGGPVPSDAAIEGAVPGVSLHTVVFNADGSKLHEGRVGVALLVAARISPSSAPNEPPTFSFVPLRDPFADRSFLMQQTARALAPFVPTMPAARLSDLARQIQPAPVEGALP
jgi:hypothetical protein